MKVPSEKDAFRRIADRLSELTGVVELAVAAEHDMGGIDAVLRLGPHTFVVEWKAVSGLAPVAAAVEQARHYVAEHFKDDGHVIPLVAVPFMTDAGSERCSEAGVAWLDLSGNAHISVPGLRIHIEGKPNQYKRRGRPSTAFAPRSSRIARWLLMHPTERFSQRELARAVDMDEGYTSKVVGKLEHDGLVVRNDSGAIRPRDPDLLLDAWRDEYEFEKHYIVKGHVPARTGNMLAKELAVQLRQHSVPNAATGLAAAWLVDQFAGFRLATIYLKDEPLPEVMDVLSFREEERGANVWLIIPNDQGVFHGAMDVNGIRCVHPVQIYLDLSAHPERAQEAAESLRVRHLNWSANND